MYFKYVVFVSNDVVENIPTVRGGLMRKNRPKINAVGYNTGANGWTKNAIIIAKAEHTPNIPVTIAL